MFNYVKTLQGYQLKSLDGDIEDIPLTLDFEIALHRHYHFPGYWDDEPVVLGKSVWREHGEPKQALTSF